MQIPDLFKKAIKDAFYDKKIEIWTPDTQTDDEGATVSNGEKKLIETINGNFQFQTREKIQEQYGLTIKANAIVTCESTIAKEGDILIYADLKPSNLYLSRYSHQELSEYTHKQLSKDITERIFIIKSVIRTDSHTTLLVEGGEENV